jgi:hypothetical protein
LPIVLMMPKRCKLISLHANFLVLSYRQQVLLKNPR